ncbi:porin [Simplicispira lacusdiani]|uniref:porin n=1 Tax=Simplicispira lacusdiani TaxID=2213010 RepID=UPI0013008219|nr:porin [Simplicispira lacusdiani]
MKKSLIALAVLGMAAGIASAQSNVSLYGRIDAGLGKAFGGKSQMQSSYKESTMWGVRGQEDLGGGLKASFNFEQGVNIEDGSLTGGASGAWNRAAWLGLGGGFGEFAMGRMTTPQNRAMGVFDLNGTANTTSALKNLGLEADGSLGGSRANSQFLYTSPNLGGFQARASVILKEDKAAPAAGAADTRKASYQLAASYKTGALNLGAVVQSKMAEGANNRTGYALGARYDFPSFAVSALYTQDESKSTGKGFGLGVVMPLGAWVLGAQVARVTDNPNPARDGATAYELFANYYLSKRTMLYAGYGGLDSAGKVVKGTTGSNTFGLGLVHKF